MLQDISARSLELQELKKKGTKVVGYFPGDYVPEELIHAAGAIPICLCHGGSSRPAEKALSTVPDVICPFARAQIGERELGTNPFYNQLDMLIAPITCIHLRKVAEIWEHEGNLEIFKLGIPHQHTSDYELNYFSDRLAVLKNSLEKLTGNQITDDKLRASIELYNKLRKTLKEISLLRRSSPSPISAMEFIKLNHASFYIDPVSMVDRLQSIYEELKSKTIANESEKPRILLLGPNISYGDYNLLETIDAAGGEIVIEEMFEGIRYYWRNIEIQGDLIQSLARGYLVERLPAAIMNYSTRERFDFAIKLIEEFQIDGVIFYELLCCETYDSESYYFAQKMAERGFPMLVLESDYITGETAQFRTCIEAFLEIINNSRGSL